jgi:hypothetical protein
MIDLSVAPVRALPRDERELFSLPAMVTSSPSTI